MSIVKTEVLLNSSFIFHLLFFRLNNFTFPRNLLAPYPNRFAKFFIFFCFTIASKDPSILILLN